MLAITCVTPGLMPMERVVKILLGDLTDFLTTDQASRHERASIRRTQRRLAYLALEGEG